jgi:hypothetical protein
MLLTDNAATTMIRESIVGSRQVVAVGRQTCSASAGPETDAVDPFDGDPGDETGRRIWHRWELHVGA